MSDTPQSNDPVTDTELGHPAPKSALGRFLALPADSVPKTLTVAVSLCLAASMIVSAAAVSLRPVQDANKLRDKQINILQVAGRYDPEVKIADAFAEFEPHVLELASGSFTEEFDPKTFDDKAASSDPALSVALDTDPASIGRKSRYKTVYLLRDTDGSVDKVILPVKGYGLWSTLYGFIAVEEDANTIFGLQFYDHAETPGLGAEVDNPRWKALWNGKKIADESGAIAITVAKTPPPAGRDYHVDALSGATLTSAGVDNLVQFWLGEEGFGPFLTKLKAGEI